MRKVAAIFFLSTFLFNLGGYYIVFWGLHLKSDNELIGLIDTSGFSGSDQVIITVPLDLPYPIYQEGSTRIHGEFEYNGEHYKLVNQKIENNILVLVCIKDHTKKHLEAAMSDYAKAANDVPSSNQQTTNLLAKLFKDFQSTEISIPTVENGWSREIGLVNFILPSFKADLSITIPPPRVS